MIMLSYPIILRYLPNSLALMPPQTEAWIRRLVCEWTALTDRVLRVGLEVPRAHSRAGATAGERRRLAQFHCVPHIVILVNGLPRVPATQEITDQKDE